MKQLDGDVTGYKPLVPIDEYLGFIAPDSLFLANRKIRDQEILLGKKRVHLEDGVWQISFLESVGVALSSSLEINRVLRLLFLTLKKFIDTDLMHVAFNENVWSGNFLLSSYALDSVLIDSFSNREVSLKQGHKHFEKVLSPTKYTYYSDKKNGSDRKGHESVTSWEFFPYSTSLSLRVAGAVVGTLTLRRREGLFTSRQVKALSSVSGQIGQTLVNSLEYLQVVKLASRDGLTGILNRRVFDEIMKREYQRAIRFHSSLSVILVDIDHFKRINDEFGHQAGDSVLKDIASVMDSAIRGVDIIARYGGEEFVILLPGTEKELAMNTAERIRRCVAGAVTKFHGNRIRVSVSMGVSSIDFSGTGELQPLPSIEELIRQSDRALYEAKEGGRDTVVAFDEFLSAGVV